MIKKREIYSKKKKRCLNCGNYGHVYRNCTFPLTSYGILLFSKKPAQDIKYLMIRRRHTFGYVEFIRANFNISKTNERYIEQLMKEMTNKELESIKTESFNTLWDNLWLNKKDHEKYHREYLRSKRNFELLLNSSVYKKVKDKTSIWETPEWGFPKGKRNKSENAIDCAKREMFEETNLKSDSIYTILSEFNPINEQFIGGDGREYKHVYYIARSEYNIPVGIDNNNIMQVREVGDIQWLTLDECIKKIRPYNIEKINMFKAAHQKISAYLQSS